jgi:hypothetical protein
MSTTGPERLSRIAKTAEALRILNDGTFSEPAIDIFQKTGTVSSESASLHYFFRSPTVE